MSALRDLDANQQVALLFVILFGLLLIVTGIAALRTLRELEGQAQVRYQRFRRELRALWVSAVLFWLAWVSGAPGATLLFVIVSFLAFREYVTLLKTRPSDHRSLILAFFIVLPLQFALVGNRNFDLFSVFIPVYVFLAIPVVSALAGDPERFLERNAKIQWGIMVCVYGLSHAPALLLLDFPRLQGRGAFLVFFLVIVATTAQIAQELASRQLRRRPVARQIDRSFSYRAFGIGVLAAAVVGTALYWITPFKAGQALVMAAIAAASGTLGEFVMRALKKDAGVSHWGNAVSVTGAVGLLDRVAPICFAAPVFFHSVRWYFQYRP
ncbi:phosphatidate cytidylyltransferase [Aquincola sp. S2]|uniref:Phosphatidate cytidylyltransferase n=1 Tax=Pseudaquabacterium terrae TaxID=2732868 RepID=A0ABX2ES62_9BURK|nr:phosphatidate cytidylyltransferase [Aquabacterium terrae]NRF71478.1 phosphatidate cytidylyltransferase [Aquabacterium terrae]